MHGIMPRPKHAISFGTSPAGTAPSTDTFGRPLTPRRLNPLCTGCPRSRQQVFVKASSFLSSLRSLFEEPRRHALRWGGLGGLSSTRNHVYDLTNAIRRPSEGLPPFRSRTPLPPPLPPPWRPTRLPRPLLRGSPPALLSRPARGRPAQTDASDGRVGVPELAADEDDVQALCNQQRGIAVARDSTSSAAATVTYTSETSVTFPLSGSNQGDTVTFECTGS